MYCNASTTVDIHGHLEAKGETRYPGGVGISCLASHTSHECWHESKHVKASLYILYSKTRLQRISGDTSKNFVIAVIRYIDIAKFVILYNEFVLHKKKKQTRNDE